MSNIDRALRLVEILSADAGGMPLTQLADRVGMPKSAAHRLLHELAALGYVRQNSDTAHYLLTTKLLSLGFTFLSATGVGDVAQPVLDQLARHSGELVRLTVVDGERLTWVAKAQGARSGLRYDPEMGQHPTLFCTASGQAWLATLEDDAALQIVAKQGFGRLGEHGPTAPRTISAFVDVLARTRAQGYAFVEEGAAAGTSALAAAVPHPRTGHAIGTVSIAGPTFRLSSERIAELAPSLRAAAMDLSQASIGSEFLAEARRAVGAGRS
jgi:DNA-binding IclR family transcriptional regulator